MIYQEKQVRILSDVKLIHKSEVYFNFQRPISNYESILIDRDRIKETTDRMHRGEIYIYKNNIYIYDGVRWYKADIKEIKEIKSYATNKLILIQFPDFDLELYSDDFSHLLALRDFLFLSNKIPLFEGNLIQPNPSSNGIGGYE
jgi:hypothetical protein